MKKAIKILIVDDDELFAESNRDLLEAYGYEVFVALDGDEGLRKAKEIRPDLMILDVMMANETQGFDVARQIKETPDLADMAVIMATGVVEAMKFPRKLEPDKEWLPVDLILEKPINPASLVEEIERILNAKKGKRNEK